MLLSTVRDFWNDRYAHGDGRDMGVRMPIR